MMVQWEGHQLTLKTIRPRIRSLISFDYYCFSQNFYLLIAAAARGTELSPLFGWLDSP